MKIVIYLQNTLVADLCILFLHFLSHAAENSVVIQTWQTLVAEHLMCCLCNCKIQV